VVKVGGGVGGRRRMGEEKKDWRRGAHGVVLTGWPGRRAGGPSGTEDASAIADHCWGKSHPPTCTCLHTPHLSPRSAAPAAGAAGPSGAARGPATLTAVCSAPKPACRPQHQCQWCWALRQCTAEKTPGPSRHPASRVKALGSFPGPGPCSGGDAHAASKPALGYHRPLSVHRSVRYAGKAMMLARQWLMGPKRPLQLGVVRCSDWRPRCTSETVN
jgi:hypothetical protein